MASGPITSWQREKVEALTDFLCQTYGLYRCESWTIKKAEHHKNQCFWTMVLEKTLESPLESKQIKPVNFKGNQPWILFGGTDAEAEVPILWPPDLKSQLIRKDPDARKLKAGEGITEDKMASLTQRTGVWGSSGRWWRTGESGVLQPMGLQRVRHNWATEQWSDICKY